MSYILKLVKVEGAKEREIILDMWSLGLNITDEKVTYVKRIPSEQTIADVIRDDFKNSL